jgi:hypothetical protein
MRRRGAIRFAGSLAVTFSGLSSGVTYVAAPMETNEEGLTDLSRPVQCVTARIDALTDQINCHYSLCMNAHTMIICCLKNQSERKP